MLVTIKDKQHNKWTNWIVWGLIILGLIGGKVAKSSSSNYTDSNNSYSEPIKLSELTNNNISSYNNQNDYAQDGTKALPAFGSQSATLSLDELRWCLYQKKCIEFIGDQFPQNDHDSDYIRTHNAKIITQNIFDKYDAFITDFNSRCSEANYHVSSKDIIDQEIRESLIEKSIKESAKNIIKTWNKDFLFKE